MSSLPGEIMALTSDFAWQVQDSNLGKRTPTVYRHLQNML
jgi:hypothetical protein